MIRVAVEKDKDGVNLLRKQVQLLHAAARPDMFRNDFSPEFADRYDFYMHSGEYTVLVYENDAKEIIGYAVLKQVRIDPSPYAVGRNFMLIEELGVEKTFRGQGIGTELVRAAKELAKENGFCRVQLDVWTFNRDAERFYVKCGFSVYRNYMEINI